ncbi:OmpA family protein [Algoriphagus litoralis]|uniref:OmpA family protein n=1 Tax=Algoriphagus litoralis TaxID=2202829 RepID=UPI000DBA2E99|nr:OmpA family protein [Algoriphagus litoralis]
MKYNPIFISFFSIAIVLAPYSSQGQFIKDLKKRAEEAAKQTVERKTEEKSAEKTEQAIDSLFNIKLKKKAGNDTSNQEGMEMESGGFEDFQYETGYEGIPGSTESGSLQAYSKFDFIMGSDILYAEDFSKAQLGDLPDGWTTSNTLEVVELNAFQGKWLQLQKGKNLFAPLTLGTLPQDFTMEFDLILDYEPTKFAAARMFTIIFNDLESPSIKLGDFYAGSHMLALGTDKGMKYKYKKWKDSQYNERATEATPILEKSTLQRGTRVRCSIWKSKNRIRFYINEEKAFDIVQAESPDNPFRSMKFYSEVYNEGENFFISNIRMAGPPPVINRELEETGLLEATGIYFETGSDEIKPESYPTLRQIADFMIKSGGSFTIAGHTDNIGEKEANRLLSESRASSVRKTLVKTYGVDTNQLASIGFGQRYPVYPNDTPEGRAKNRRVDIINLAVYEDYEGKLIEKVYGEARK